MLVGVIMMSPSVNELGKRIKYSTFSESVNVERDRPALAGYRTAHRREGVVIIEIFERRDVTTDKLVLRHRLTPLSHLVIDPDIHVRRKRLRVLPVVRVEDAAYTPVRRMLGNDSFEGCEKHCVMDDKTGVAVILVNAM